MAEIKPKKELGQHWLYDQGVLDAICVAADVAVNVRSLACVWCVRSVVGSDSWNTFDRSLATSTAPRAATRH